jgi:hypothetical protein
LKLKCDILVSNSNLYHYTKAGAVADMLRLSALAKRVAALWQREVGLYKLNPVDESHSLKAPGFNP